MTLHLIKSLQLCKRIENEELVVTLGDKVFEHIKVDVAKDENALLHFSIIFFLSLHSINLIRIQFVVVDFIGPGGHFKTSEIDLKITIQDGLESFVNLKILNFGPKYLLAQVI